MFNMVSLSLHKKQKLANAIKEYRGSYVEGTETIDPVTQKITSATWIRHPKSSTLTRIRSMLILWNIPVEKSIHTINNFKSLKEFYNWLDNL